MLLADDFLTDYKPGVTADLVSAFANTGKSQLSVMKSMGPISQIMGSWYQPGRALALLV